MYRTMKIRNQRLMSRERRRVSLVQKRRSCWMHHMKKLVKQGVLDRRVVGLSMQSLVMSEDYQLDSHHSLKQLAVRSQADIHHNFVLLRHLIREQK